jgi:hypothetical protein
MTAKLLVITLGELAESPLALIRDAAHWYQAAGLPDETIIARVGLGRRQPIIRIDADCPGAMLGDAVREMVLYANQPAPVGEPVRAAR